MTGCGPTSQIDAQLLAAPAEVRERTDLPDCGVELVGSGGPFDLEARQCFWDAYLQGLPAEFITTRPAGGGQPLLVIFRTLGNRKVEYYADLSAIAGKPSWALTTCTGLTPTNDPAVAIDWIPGTLEAPCTQKDL
jgi:hypothetical protein